MGNGNSPTSILILDDEPIVSKRLKPFLERKGYEIEAFTDSLQALERVKQRPFNIIITDLKMEGLDGMQFLTKVKEELSPETEIIVITGFATLATAKQSFQKGVFDFLAKPFKLAELEEVVKKAEMKIKKGQQQ